jgi:hypothetical protein
MLQKGEMQDECANSKEEKGVRMPGSKLYVVNLS